jgi:tRNA nucleotidyltransferase (CCA-adding enzyme)
MKRQFPVDPRVQELAVSIHDAGGRALVVGGWVRDRLLAIDSKDYDLEVFGLTLNRLEEVLSRFGEVIAIGRSFGVLHIKGMALDVAIPRKDSKAGRGHRGFVVDLDPELDFEEAARRRDLTINSIGYDPLDDEIMDPHHGVSDLRAGRLRATDPGQFADDSLRGLRVAQFMARFKMKPDRELRELCAGLDLSDLPGERIQEEFRKLLLQSERPSAGFEFLRETGLLRFFPELEAMVGVPQDPVWHPEGTVWEHTLMVLDEAARLRTGDRGEDWILMLGALCHDLGKPATTVVGDDGKIRSPGHEPAGVPVAETFLERLRTAAEVMAQVGGLVRHHLAPMTLVKDGATAKGFRRLARRLAAAGLDARQLHRLASVDHFGRTTPDALAREFPAGDEFLRRMEELAIADEATPDVVMGRHLIARGLYPGRKFGVILEACREIQDETGWDDPDRILDRVLAG